jgi:hypothetical protein
LLNYFKLSPLWGKIEVVGSIATLDRHIVFVVARRYGVISFVAEKTGCWEGNNRLPLIAILFLLLPDDTELFTLWGKIEL